MRTTTFIPLFLSVGLVTLFFVINLKFTSTHIWQKTNETPGLNLNKIELNLKSIVQNQKLLRQQLSKVICQHENIVTATGGWCLFPQTEKILLTPDIPLAIHHVAADAGLAPFLATLFGESQILDMGAGIGQYEIYWSNNNSSVHSTALDGAVNVEEYTHGLVSWADFTLPLYMEDEFDWVMSLEVGEHIPAQYEGQFVDNLHKNNLCGVVLSWGVPGQGGHSHVNLKSNDDVVRLFSSLGYTYDEQSSAKGRSVAKYGWFKSTFMVFRRNFADSFRCKE